jgi:ferritin
MEMNKKLEDAFNKQINKELHSGYIYLSMSAYFENENFPGMAKWMKHQAQEEYEHAMKLFNFLVERGNKVELKAIDAVPTTWKSPLDVFETALNHEKKVTGLIHSLLDLSMQEKDHPAVSHLQWFVDEQVEEEASADAIVQKLKMTDGHKHVLLMLDKELSQRS